jgi:hypothetical protein
MVLMIRWYVGRYFRWFDSGDIQSHSHLYNICEVARHTAEIHHWLPTQEHELVREFDEEIPDNLTIRLSAHMLDEGAPSGWPHTSTVFTKRPPVGSHVCPASDQGNYCGACRSCWGRNVPQVSYHWH